MRLQKSEESLYLNGGSELQMFLRFRDISYPDILCVKNLFFVRVCSLQPTRAR